MKLFSVLGIEIKINYLLIPIIVLSIYFSYFFELLMVACVIILHELAHSVAAYYYDVHITEIEVFPFGGVAKAVSYIETRPVQEIVIAASGPAMNLLLYSVASLLKNVIPMESSRVEFFLLINSTICLFNLIPLLPLDGGRILRATLAKVVGIRRATKAIIIWGKLLCMAIFILGIFLSFEKMDNLFLSALGVFLYYKTHQEKERAAFAFMQELVGKKQVLLYRGVMDVKYLIAYEEVEVHKVFKQFLDGKYHIISVVDQKGHIMGSISESKMIDAMIKYGSRERLGSVIEKLNNKED